MGVPADIDSNLSVSSTDSSPRTGVGQPSSAASNRPQWVFAAILIGSYALLSFCGSFMPASRGLGAALSIGPVALVAIYLAWRWLQPVAAILVTVAAAAVLYRYWNFLERNFEWSDLVQQCGIYLLVAAGFAHSLAKSQVPLCTQLALKLHGSLTPGEAAYLRGATAAYALFYGLLAAVIGALFFKLSEKSWSFFVNFVTYALIAAACLADIGIRRLVFRNRKHAGVLTMLRRSLIG